MPSAEKDGASTDLGGVGQTFAFHRISISFISFISKKRNLSIMKTASPSSSRLISPDPDQARQAREAARLFAGMAATARGSQSLRLIPEGRDAQPVEVPEPAFRLFLVILNQMAQGNPVTIVPTCRELTTQQAADLLNVSGPYFEKLLETGAIEHHRVGTRRRVNFQHLMTYMENAKSESRKALEELAAEAQELGLGY